MKKWVCALLTVLLMLSAAAAEGENALLRHAVELGRELDAMAEDEQRIRLYSLGAEKQAMVLAYGAGSHDAPCEVRESALDDALALLQEEVSGLPEAGQRRLMNLLPTMLLQSSINALDEDAIIASSIMRTGVTFANEHAQGQGLWLLMYEDAATVAVAWYAENGAVNMTAMFLPEDAELPGESRVIAAARPELDAYALSLAEELQALAGSSEYLHMLGLSEDVIATGMDFRAAEDGSPRLVLCGLTDNVQAASAYLSQQAGNLGVLPLVAMSSMRTDVIFAEPDASGEGLYLLLYEDGVPIVITWMGENGAYSLTASFMPGEAPASCRSAEDADAWAASIGLDVRFQLPGAMLLP